MIKFNIAKKCFEHSEEELENYIKVKLNDSYFNETQIKTLSELVCNFVDSLCEHYSQYFGNMLIILNSIIDDKNIKGIAYGKINKLFTSLISYSAGQNDKKIDSLIDTASKIYHLTTVEGNLVRFLNLQNFGKNDGYSTEEQMIEVKNIIMDFLRECRENIEISNIYRLQKDRNHLFSDKERLNNHFSDLIADIEKKNSVKSPVRYVDLEEQNLNDEESRKRRSPTENAEISELQPKAKKSNTANIDYSNLFTELTNSTLNVDITKCNDLLKKGIDPNTLDIYGFSALQKAAQNGHLEICKLLLNWGADVNYSNQYGSAYDRANYNNHIEICNYLKENGAVINDIMNKDEELCIAAGSGDEQKFLSLLQNGADINYKNKNGHAPIHRAAYNGHLNIINIIINFERAEIDIVDNNHLTALNYVIQKGDLNICKTLIDQGADVSHLDNEKISYLVSATYYGYEEICKLLLEKGINLHIKNKNGNAALHVAASQRNITIFKMLIEYCADINDKNASGKTAINILIEYTDFTDFDTAFIVAQFALSLGVIISDDNVKELFSSKQKIEDDQKFKELMKYNDILKSFPNYMRNFVNFMKKICDKYAFKEYFPIFISDKIASHLNEPNIDHKQASKIVSDIRNNKPVTRGSFASYVINKKNDFTQFI